MANGEFGDLARTAVRQRDDQLARKFARKTYHDTSTRRPREDEGAAKCHLHVHHLIIAGITARRNQFRQ